LNPPISPATRLVALLGDPVDHSLSPIFQNAAIAERRLDAVYLALRCDAGDFPGLLEGIARAGGAGNVTVPHKELAARVVEEPTEAVTRTGACNTFWLQDGQIRGDNTDVVGFSAAVRELLGHTPAGARALLIGAGGAARAAAYSLSIDGADAVVVLNRSPTAARDLTDRFESNGTEFSIADSIDSLRGEAFDLVVNATSLGIRAGDPQPLPVDPDMSIGAALDLVYRADLTPWVRVLRQRGVPATDGLGMLIHQGAAAFSRWWGAPAPVDAMRAALPPR
jgi:shikimate dehydrogenase